MDKHNLPLVRHAVNEFGRLLMIVIWFRNLISQEGLSLSERVTVRLKQVLNLLPVYPIHLLSYSDPGSLLVTVNLSSDKFLMNLFPHLCS